MRWGATSRLTAAALVVLGAPGLAGSWGCGRVPPGQPTVETVTLFSREELGRAVEALRGARGWEAVGPLAFRLRAGLRLGREVEERLGERLEIPMPPELGLVEGPGPLGRGALLLGRLDALSWGEEPLATGLSLVGVGWLQPETGQLVLAGDRLAPWTPMPHGPGAPDAGGIGRTYLLVESPAVAFVAGRVETALDPAKPTPLAGAAVAGDRTPFTSVSDEQGRFLLPVPAADDATLVARRPEGEPALVPISTLARLDLTGGDGVPRREERGRRVGAPAGGLGKDAPSPQPLLPTAAAPPLEGRPLLETALRLAALPWRGSPPLLAPPLPAWPTPDLPAEKPHRPERPVLRHLDPPPWNHGVDLGCAGVEGLGAPLAIIHDPTQHAAYDRARGWRAVGDVRYAFDFVAEIFGPPAAAGERYLDQLPGYCVLTTGDGLYRESGREDAYRPGPAGAGRVSEMWQKVDVPPQARSLQVRVAILSQEFPRELIHPGGDGIAIRFDETPGFLLAADLRTLAGWPEPAARAALEDCARLEGAEPAKGCGAWRWTAAVPGLHGQGWGIRASAEAATDGARWGCLAPGVSSGPCYGGLLGPLLLCRDLDPAREAGQRRTLRISVYDGADSYLDTALLVDGVAFSTRSCLDAAGHMVRDPLR